ncbi:glycosyltransferase family 4 protein [Sphingomonas sp. LHG3443-2]|uniref:glycosyltransferase family 4 protein n=1 Tax=Sphingomonas sp. LHG3443-2 TaxID=2804639 RepID=UPI003CF4DDAF
MSIYAQNLLEQLVAGGHEVTMISQFRGDAFGARVYGGGPPPEVPGVRVIGLEQRGEQDGGDFERDIDEMVETIVAEHGRQPFDILHAQYGYPTGWAALLASRRIRVPTIVSIQGGDGHWVGSCCETHAQAMVRVLDHAGALLIGGRSFAGEVSERLGTAPERFTIVPGAVDTRRFTPGPSLAAEPIRILYHGRVDRRKGVLDFLHALPMVAGEWQATVSGVGPDFEAANALALHLGLGNRVAFTGYADYAAVPALYRRHHIFASPTYAEGFSNTILEAMASGLTVLSCHSVGVVDCIRDGENGLLVAHGDITAQAEALSALVTHAGLRSQLAAAALEECRATYSWEEVGRQIIGIYQALAGSQPDLAFTPDLPRSPCRFRTEPHLL